MNNMSIDLESEEGRLESPHQGGALLKSYRAIGDVELTLCAELDHRVISVRDLLDLEVGDLLSLSRPAGENITLYAESVLIGSAEILVTDEKIGVRIAELCDQLASPQIIGQSVLLKGDQ